jgi:hypothetical protein
VGLKFPQKKKKKKNRVEGGEKIKFQKTEIMGKKKTKKG